MCMLSYREEIAKYLYERGSVFFFLPCLPTTYDYTRATKPGSQTVLNELANHLSHISVA